MPAHVLLVDDLVPLWPSGDDEVVEAGADRVGEYEDGGIENSAGVCVTASVSNVASHGRRTYRDRRAK